MDRQSIYFIGENDKDLFDYDEELPPLPLPDLDETLKRYYECLIPFGSDEELANSRANIERFRNGVGKQLHGIIKERAKTCRNWLDSWWDDYAYGMLRMPLNPYVTMQMPVQLDVLGIPETSENFLKTLSRMTYHTIEFWNLLRKEAMKPLTSNGGKIKYTSKYYKRFFSTTRVPGTEIDHVESQFKTVKEGKTPTHGLVSGKGRLFIFDTVNEDGSLVSVIELYALYKRIRNALDNEPLGQCIPVLTHDDRTSWANNRQRLMEVSPSNKNILHLVEGSSIVIAFDENEPQSIREVSELIGYGDYHSKWGDRSSTIVAYKTGRFGYIGEHSAYDGTYSVSYALFIHLSLSEVPEPNWDEAETAKIITFRELKFELTETLRNEIKNVMKQCDDRKTDMTITFEVFQDYGKEYMKECKLHPDSFIQVLLQWTYHRLHDEVPSTYETALMRQYHDGRTETLRSLTNKVYEFFQVAKDPKSSKQQIVKAFRNAVENHNFYMNEARKGHGIDRHLFGLWCAAYENKIEIPDYFYDDVLYKRSGGGGNFTLSTSCLGYTHLVGFVAPMVMDGYAAFYGISPYAIFIQVSSYRDSTKANADRFTEAFIESFRKIKSLLESVQNSNL